MRREKIKRIWGYTRVLISVGLIALLLWKLDINKILENIKGTELKFLLFALIPYLLFIGFSAWRWQVLLDYKKFKTPFPKTMRIYFISLFFNNFLPTTVGGDVMRVLYTMGKRKADALATVLVDRVLGFVGLFIFALVAVLYLFIKNKESEFLFLMIIGLVAIIAITYIIFSEKIYKVLSPIIGKIKIFSLGEKLSHLYETTTSFGCAWGPIFICIIQSIIIQALLAYGPFLVLRGMGNTTVSLLSFFIYVPIINVISMIPISLNGLGIRENSYVLLFQRVGVMGETSLTVSLISFFLVFLYSLIGGIFFIIYKRR